jgi:hypothetical protein
MISDAARFRRAQELIQLKEELCRWIDRPSDDLPPLDIYRMFGCIGKREAKGLAQGISFTLHNLEL